MRTAPCCSPAGYVAHVTLALVTACDAMISIDQPRRGRFLGRSSSSDWLYGTDLGDHMEFYWQKMSCTQSPWRRCPIIQCDQDQTEQWNYLMFDDLMRCDFVRSVSPKFSNVLQLKSCGIEVIRMVPHAPLTQAHQVFKQPESPEGWGLNPLITPTTTKPWKVDKGRTIGIVRLAS